jgi:cysteine desulfurase/selenocysteine lyase
VYLDSAASSQKPRAVLEAMAQYYTTSHANVHRSIHTLGEEATELYEAARDRVQRFIGAASREEVVFTRGTTDGINLVAEALGRMLRPGTRSSSPTWSTTRTSSRGRWRPGIAA